MQQFRDLLTPAELQRFQRLEMTDPTFEAFKFRFLQELEWIRFREARHKEEREGMDYRRSMLRGREDTTPFTFAQQEQLISKGEAKTRELREKLFDTALERSDPATNMRPSWTLTKAALQDTLRGFAMTESGELAPREHRFLRAPVEGGVPKELQTLQERGWHDFWEEKGKVGGVADLIWSTATSPYRGVKAVTTGDWENPLETFAELTSVFSVGRGLGQIAKGSLRAAGRAPVAASRIGKVISHPAWQGLNIASDVADVSGAGERGAFLEAFGEGAFEVGGKSWELGGNLIAMMRADQETDALIDEITGSKTSAPSKDYFMGIDFEKHFEEAAAEAGLHIAREADFSIAPQQPDIAPTQQTTPTTDEIQFKRDDTPAEMEAQQQQQQAEQDAEQVTEERPTVQERVKRVVENAEKISGESITDEDTSSGSETEPKSSAEQTAFRMVNETDAYLDKEFLPLMEKLYEEYQQSDEDSGRKMSFVDFANRELNKIFEQHRTGDFLEMSDRDSIAQALAKKLEQRATEASSAKRIMEEYEKEQEAAKEQEQTTEQTTEPTESVEETPETDSATETITTDDFTLTPEEYKTEAHGETMSHAAYKVEKAGIDYADLVTHQLTERQGGGWATSVRGITDPVKGTTADTAEESAQKAVDLIKGFGEVRYNAFVHAFRDQRSGGSLTLDQQNYIESLMDMDKWTQEGNTGVFTHEDGGRIEVERPRKEGQRDVATITDIPGLKSPLYRFADGNNYRERARQALTNIGTSGFTGDYQQEIDASKEAKQDDSLSAIKDTKNWERQEQSNTYKYKLGTGEADMVGRGEMASVNFTGLPNQQPLFITKEVTGRSIRDRLKNALDQLTEGDLDGSERGDETPAGEETTPTKEVSAEERRANEFARRRAERRAAKEETPEPAQAQPEPDESPEARRARLFAERRAARRAQKEREDVLSDISAEHREDYELWEEIAVEDQIAYLEGKDTLNDDEQALLDVLQKSPSERSTDEQEDFALWQEIAIEDQIAYVLQSEENLSEDAVALVDALKAYQSTIGTSEPDTSADVQMRNTKNIQLATWVADTIQAGTEITRKSLINKANEIYGGTFAEGAYEFREAYDAVEVGGMILIDRLVKEWNMYQLAEDRGGAEYLINAINDRVIANLPKPTRRDAEQIEAQQFSTPFHYAYVANWVANIQDGDIILEPSAGTGNLAWWGRIRGNEVHVNEIADRRLAMLRESGFQNVTNFDARNLNNLMKHANPDFAPTIVVMNPPFSSDRETGTKSEMLGANMVTEALKTLAPGGRLVAIVSGGSPAFDDSVGMAFDGSQQIQRWWDETAENYTIRANIKVLGEDYAKFGTEFDTRLLVIDKPLEGNKPKAVEAVTGEAAHINDIPAMLEGVRNATRDGTDTTEPDRDESAGEDVTETREPGSEREPSVSSAADGVGDGEQQRTDGTDEGRGRSTSTLPVQSRDASSQAEPDDSQTSDEQDGGRGDATEQTTEQPDTSGVRSDQSDDGDTDGEGIEDNVYELIKEKHIEGTPLVTSKNLAAIDKPDASDVDVNIPNPQELSEAQMTLVQSIIRIHGQFKGAVQDAAGAVGDVLRKAFYVGDGTGVGKTREAAATIIHNQNNGVKKHIVLTRDWKLVEKFRKDYAALGGDPDHVYHGSKKTKTAEKIPFEEGVVVMTYKTLAAAAGSKSKEVYPDGRIEQTLEWLVGEKPPPGVLSAENQAGETIEDLVRLHREGELPGNALSAVSKFLDEDAEYRIPASFRYLLESYQDALENNEQRQVDRIDEAYGQELERIEEASQNMPEEITTIDEWRAKASQFEGVIVLDESHTVKNLGVSESASGRGRWGRSANPAKVALTALTLRQFLPNARIIYMSATGTTKLSDAAYLERLSLFGPGTPYPTFSQFYATFSRSLGLQELVFSELKALGEFDARTLDMSGVEYDKIEHELTPEQIEHYNVLTNIWHQMYEDIGQYVRANRRQAKEAGASPRGELSDLNKQFWSANQTFWINFLMASQMDTVMNKALELLKNGEKVVFRVVSTNAASQERVAAQGEADDVDLEDLQVTLQEHVLKFLNEIYPVESLTVRRNPQTQRARQEVATDAAGDEVLDQEMVRKRDELLAQMNDINMPSAALDTIVQRLRDEGYEVAEVTGREERYVWDNETGERVLEKSIQKRKEGDIERFLEGDLRALVFSTAGSTGLDYHSLPGQPKHHLFVVQAGWQTDELEQSMGRVHRTGQSGPPVIYVTGTDSPAEARAVSTALRHMRTMGAQVMGSEEAGAARQLYGTGIEQYINSDIGLLTLRGMFRELIRTRDRIEVEGLLDEDGNNMRLNAQQILGYLGLTRISDSGDQTFNESELTIDRFLNRILNSQIAVQRAIFSRFMRELESNVSEARTEGTLDRGAENIDTESAEVVSETVLTTDRDSGAQSKLVEVDTEVINPKFTWERLVQRIQNARPNQTGAFIGFRRLVRGQVVAAFRGSTQQVGSEYVSRVRFVKVSGADDFANVNDSRFTNAEDLGTEPTPEIQKIWQEQYDAIPDTVEKKMFLVTGLVTQTWNQTGATREAEAAMTMEDRSASVRIRRITLNDGTTLLGRFIPERQVPFLLQEFEATRGQDTPVVGGTTLTPQAILDRILGGDPVRLEVGWTLASTTRDGQDIIILRRGQGPSQTTTDMQELGLRSISGTGGLEWFVPHGDTTALENLLRRYPPRDIEMETQDGAQVDDETPGGSDGGNQGGGSVSTPASQTPSSTTPTQHGSSTPTQTEETQSDVVKRQIERAYQLHQANKDWDISKAVNNAIADTLDEDSNALLPTPEEVEQIKTGLLRMLEANDPTRQEQPTELSPLAQEAQAILEEYPDRTIESAVQSASARRLQRGQGRDSRLPTAEEKEAAIIELGGIDPHEGKSDTLRAWEKRASEHEANLMDLAKDGISSLPFNEKRPAPQTPRDALEYLQNEPLSNRQEDAEHIRYDIGEHGKVEIWKGTPREDGSYHFKSVNLKITIDGVEFEKNRSGKTVREEEAIKDGLKNLSISNLEQAYEQDTNTDAELDSHLQALGIERADWDIWTEEERAVGVNRVHEELQMREVSDENFNISPEQIRAVNFLISGELSDYIVNPTDADWEHAFPQSKADRAAIRETYRKQVEQIINEESDTDAKVKLRELNKELVSGDYFGLQGRKVETGEEAALIAQFIRNPVVEGTLLLLRKGGKVVRAEYLSLGRTATTTPGVIRDVERMIADTEADDFIRVHNHPSKKAIFSGLDKDAVVKWRNKFGNQLAEEVIINAGTYARASFDNDGNVEYQNELELDIKSNDLAKPEFFGAFMKTPKGWTTLLIVDDAGKIISAMDIHGLFDRYDYLDRVRKLFSLTPNAAGMHVIAGRETGQNKSITELESNVRNLSDSTDFVKSSWIGGRPTQIGPYTPPHQVGLGPNTFPQRKSIQRDIDGQTRTFVKADPNELSDPKNYKPVVIAGITRNLVRDEYRDDLPVGKRVRGDAEHIVSAKQNLEVERLDAKAVEDAREVIESEASKPPDLTEKDRLQDRYDAIEAEIKEIEAYRTALREFTISIMGDTAEDALKIIDNTPILQKDDVRNIFTSVAPEANTYEFQATQKVWDIIKDVDNRRRALRSEANDIRSEMRNMKTPEFINEATVQKLKDLTTQLSDNENYRHQLSQIMWSTGTVEDAYSLIKAEPVLDTNFIKGVLKGHSMTKNVRDIPGWINKIGDERDRLFDVQKQIRSELSAIRDNADGAQRELIDMIEEINQTRKMSVYRIEAGVERLSEEAQAKINPALDKLWGHIATEKGVFDRVMESGHVKATYKRYIDNVETALAFTSYSAYYRRSEGFHNYGVILDMEKLLDEMPVVFGTVHERQINWDDRIKINTPEEIRAAMKEHHDSQKDMVIEVSFPNDLDINDYLIGIIEDSEVYVLEEKHSDNIETDYPDDDGELGDYVAEVKAANPDSVLTVPVEHMSDLNMVGKGPSITEKILRKSITFFDPSSPIRQKLDLWTPKLRQRAREATQTLHTAWGNLDKLRAPHGSAMPSPADYLIEVLFERTDGSEALRSEDLALLRPLQKKRNALLKKLTKETGRDKTNLRKIVEYPVIEFIEHNKPIQNNAAMAQAGITDTSEIEAFATEFKDAWRQSNMQRAGYIVQLVEAAKEIGETVDIELQDFDGFQYDWEAGGFRKMSKWNDKDGRMRKTTQAEQEKVYSVEEAHKAADRLYVPHKYTKADIERKLKKVDALVSQLNTAMRTEDISELDEAIGIIENDDGTYSFKYSDEVFDDVVEAIAHAQTYWSTEQASTKTYLQDVEGGVIGIFGHLERRRETDDRFYSRDIDIMVDVSQQALDRIAEIRAFGHFNPITGSSPRVDDFLNQLKGWSKTPEEEAFLAVFDALRAGQKDSRYERAWDLGQGNKDADYDIIYEWRDRKTGEFTELDVEKMKERGLTDEHIKELVKVGFLDKDGSTHKVRGKDAIEQLQTIQQHFTNFAQTKALRESVVVDVIRGLGNWDRSSDIDKVSHKIMRAVNGLTTVMTLGHRTALQNLLEYPHAQAMIGAKNSAKALADFTKDPDFRRLSQRIVEAMRHTTQFMADTTFEQKHLQNLFLSGFSWSDQFSRAMGAAGGIVNAEQVIRDYIANQTKANRAALRAVKINQDVIDKYRLDTNPNKKGLDAIFSEARERAGTGALPIVGFKRTGVTAASDPYVDAIGEQVFRSAVFVSNTVLKRYDAVSLPSALRTTNPFLRLFTKFIAWPVQHHSYLFRQLRYAINEAKGNRNWKPAYNLLSATAYTAAMGAGTATLFAALQGRFDEDDDYLEKALRGVAASHAFGMASMLMEAALFAEGNSWLLEKAITTRGAGPTIGKWGRMGAPYLTGDWAEGLEQTMRSIPVLNTAFTTTPARKIFEGEDD